MDNFGSQEEPGIGTLSIHGGGHKKNAYNAVVPPITLATSFVQENIGESGEFCYARCDNPTRLSYENALASLEKGIYATATASGVAAAALVLELFPKDSHVIVMNGVYGGTFRLFEVLRTFTSGYSFSYIDINDIVKLEAAIRSNQNTKLIWIESPTNPLLNLVDINSVCKVARKHRIVTCVDNTFATAFNQRPLLLGADIVMLSTSKYIGGHSDLIGGAVITNSKELASKLAFVKTTVGAIQSPFDSYIALRGLKSLHLRMARQCSNAQKIAEFLETHPRILSVTYPGLKSHKQYGLAQKQMRTGGAVITVRLKGGMDESKSFISKLNYFIFAESLGGIESMVNHSASMSHGSMSKDARESIGIYDTTLRLSVGAEDVEDLLGDLRQALERT